MKNPLNNHKVQEKIQELLDDGKKVYTFDECPTCLAYDSYFCSKCLGTQCMDGEFEAPNDAICVIQGMTGNLTEEFKELLK